MNIEKEELIRRLKIAEPYNNKDVPQYVWSIINAIPDAERTGKWISDWNRKIKMIDGCPNGSCHCSYCGEWLVASDEYAVKGIYCPNCGARMIEGEEK